MMRGHERNDNRVMTEFMIQPVLQNKEWKYMGARVLVTTTADAFLVRHMVGLIRH